MIRKQLDSVTLNSYAGSNNELIVPSKIITSYAKSDASDLSYTNFMISTEMNTSYVGDIYVGGRYAVTFEGDESASCYMNVVSWCNTRNGVKLTLMYSDGLTVDDSSDDPEEPTVDPELSQSINNILGSNYDVINDMSDEDALAAANNILYGDEEPPR